MLLLDYARDEVGLTMKGLHVGRHCGYTTDPDKAQAMREAGAHVTSILGRNDGVSAAWPPYTFPSWEISFLVGSELRAPAAA